MRRARRAAHTQIQITGAGGQTISQRWIRTRVPARGAGRVRCAARPLAASLLAGPADARQPVFRAGKCATGRHSTRSAHAAGGPLDAALNAVATR